jgi:hypothetical protein
LVHAGCRKSRSPDQGRGRERAAMAGKLAQ